METQTTSDLFLGVLNEFISDLQNLKVEGLEVFTDVKPEQKNEFKETIEKYKDDIFKGNCDSLIKDDYQLMGTIPLGKILKEATSVTKQACCGHLQMLYLTCSGGNGDDINELVEKMKNAIPEEAVEKPITLDETTIANASENVKKMFQGANSENTQLTDFVGEMTTDLAKTLQGKQVSPVDLLGGLMGQKSSFDVQGLIQGMAKKLETKIETGQIDAAQLQNQTTVMLKNLQNQMGAAGMPNLGGSGGGMAGLMQGMKLMTQMQNLDKKPIKNKYNVKSKKKRRK